MKRKISFCSLMLLLATIIMASENRVLTVHLTDQRTVSFVIPDQQPHVYCGEGLLEVYFNNEKEDSENSYLSFNIAEVVNMTIDSLNISAIKDINPQDPRIRFDLTNGSKVHVFGLQDGDNLQIVSLDGKSVQVPVNRVDAEAVIDLSSQQRGCYIISVNSNFTFKLMKP